MTSESAIFPDVLTSSFSNISDEIEIQLYLWKTSNKRFSLTGLLKHTIWPTFPAKKDWSYLHISTLTSSACPDFVIIFGILLFTLLMSIVCRLFYVMTIKSNFPFLGIPNFATIGCASMIPQVFLSFFGVSLWGWFGYWLSYKSLFIITLLFFFYGKNIIKYHKII